MTKRYLAVLFGIITFISIATTALACGTLEVSEQNIYTDPISHTAISDTPTTYAELGICVTPNITVYGTSINSAHTNEQDVTAIANFTYKGIEVETGVSAQFAGSYTGVPIYVDAGYTIDVGKVELKPYARITVVPEWDRGGYGAVQAYVRSGMISTVEIKRFNIILEASVTCNPHYGQCLASELIDIKHQLIENVDVDLSVNPVQCGYGGQNSCKSSVAVKLGATLRFF